MNNDKDVDQHEANEPAVGESRFRRSYDYHRLLVFVVIVLLLFLIYVLRSGRDKEHHHGQVVTYIIFIFTIFDIHQS